MNFLVMPIFFLSGALFPLNTIPREMRIVANLDPLSYSVDGLRFALIGVTHFGIALDVSVLCLVTAAALAIGGYLFSRIQA
jgi:ABC-2 type transport system permease protein